MYLDLRNYHAKLLIFGIMKYFISLQYVRVYLKLMVCHTIAEASNIM